MSKNRLASIEGPRGCCCARQGFQRGAVLAQAYNIGRKSCSIPDGRKQRAAPVADQLPRITTVIAKQRNAGNKGLYQNSRRFRGNVSEHEEVDALQERKYLSPTGDETQESNT